MILDFYFMKRQATFSVRLPYTLLICELDQIRPTDLCNTWLRCDEDVRLLLVYEDL